MTKQLAFEYKKLEILFIFTVDKTTESFILKNLEILTIFAVHKTIDIFIHKILLN